MFIQRILCPTDLSKNSKSGIACAASLAREHKAELIILHVTKFPAPPTPYGCEPELLGLPRVSFTQFTVDNLLKEGANKVRSFLRGSLQDELNALPWRIRIELGHVAKEIVSSARHEKADLIVMAKRERSFLLRLFSHSVSEAVGRAAPCPVLSVCPAKLVQEWHNRQAPLVTMALGTTKA